MRRFNRIYDKVVAVDKIKSVLFQLRQKKINKKQKYAKNVLKQVFKQQTLKIKKKSFLQNSLVSSHVGNHSLFS